MSLPSGYTELEYLQSTGTQYIYSNLLGFTSTDRLELKFRVDTLTGSSGTGYMTVIGTNSNFQYSYYTNGFCIGNNGVAYPGIAVGNIYNGSIINNTIYVEGVSTGLTRGAVATGNTIFHNGIGGYTPGGTIYYIKKYDSSDNLTLNLVAAKDSNNVYGFYDTVSNTFLTNTGTGTFVPGPEVTAINKVVYNGTTLIDLTNDTVSADKVLQGYTAHSADGRIITGNYVPSGATGNATVADVLSGKTFSNSSSTGLTGTMSNRGAISGTISSRDAYYYISQGYHNGSGYVRISATERAKIMAENIKSGVSILGVSGSLTPGITPTGTLSITENGTYDVTSYASAEVNVPAGGEYYEGEVS